MPDLTDTLPTVSAEAVDTLAADLDAEIQAIEDRHREALVGLRTLVADLVVQAQLALAEVRWQTGRSSPIDSHCHVTRADTDGPCVLGAHEGDVHEELDGTEYRTVALTRKGGRRG
jgi:hypothetical protein